jgi:integrase
MPLSDKTVSGAKPREKAYKLSDERGLYLLVMPTGGRLWRLDYRFAGKRKTMALGIYKDVGLAAARERRDEARKLVASGIDPMASRKAGRDAAHVAATNSFEAVGREWLKKQHLADITRAKALWMFEEFLFPWIGGRPVSQVTSPELLAVLQKLEARGKLETAQRVKQQAGRVFRYAIATGRALSDPSVALRGAMATPKTKHQASITDPKLIGPLLSAMDGYQGDYVTWCALKLAPMLFVRPGELRQAEWSEFDLESGEWRIPAEKMKMRQLHLVPLSQQAIKVLRELQPLTGGGRYVFPGIRGRGRPMSENTVLGALRRLGYKGNEMSGHGFRSMASTRLHEMGWRPEYIERQLAHADPNKVSGAYNYAEHLPERRTMMQAWADYLDLLHEGGNVVTGDFEKAA